VICGHIHAATIRDTGGLAYLNCGDWVDSCTAIVEHDNGAMELVLWGSEDEGIAREAADRRAPIPVREASRHETVMRQF